MVIEQTTIRKNRTAESNRSNEEQRATECLTIIILVKGNSDFLRYSEVVLTNAL